MTHFTHQQIQLLAQIIIDEVGDDLSLDELKEQINLLLENTAGLEGVSEQSLSLIVNQIRSEYHGNSSKENNEHHTDQINQTNLTG